MSASEDMSEELIEVKPEFMGIQTTGYVGAFPPAVERRVGQIAEHPLLHLFSGRSRLGDVRVDLERPEATINCDVLEFVRNHNADYKFVIADPPYELYNADEKLRQYASKVAVSASIPLRTAIEEYLRLHVDNVLWFDYCIPPFRGFGRYKVWLYAPHGWAKIRALTWLKRKGERLI